MTPAAAGSGWPRRAAACCDWIIRLIASTSLSRFGESLVAGLGRDGEPGDLADQGRGRSPRGLGWPCE